MQKRKKNEYALMAKNKMLVVSTPYHKQANALSTTTIVIPHFDPLTFLAYKMINKRRTADLTSAATTCWSPISNTRKAYANSKNTNINTITMKTICADFMGKR